MDESRPKLLRTTPTEAEAVFVVAHLDGHGIDAWSEGGLIAGFRAEAPGGGVNVYVHDEDFARADALLRQDPEPLEEPDEDATPPIAPEPARQSGPGLLGGLFLVALIVLIVWLVFRGVGFP